MTTLRLQVQPTAPLEAGIITPDCLLGKNAAEIAALPLMHGNAQVPLGDVFAVESDGSANIFIEGDLSLVKQVGTGMTQGSITIHGDAGMHLGAGMRGGKIVVQGNAGDWAGAELRGGQIHIKGNAGHGLGGAYRGSRHGMNRGVIVVQGNAGNETGALMRRGLVIVQGDVGDFAGAFMIAGTIVVLGQLGVRAGAGMKWGTILTFHRPELLPTFRYDCVYRPTFLRLLVRELYTLGVEIPNEYLEGCYQR